MKLLNCWANFFQLNSCKQRNPVGLTETMQQYFAGELAVIDYLPIMTAGSEFQHNVLRQLRQFPCGEILTYGEYIVRTVVSTSYAFLLALMLS